MQKKGISGIPINIDESLILERAVDRRDKKAVVFLYARYYTHMKQYIASRIRSIADAEDLAQNIFLEICKGSGRYDRRRNNNVEAYLLGMAKNAIRRYHRERKKPVKIISINSANDIATIPNIHQRQNPARQVSTQELQRAIEDAVVQLPLRAREAIRLKFINGLSTEQAAQKAGCTPGTFYARLSYALKALRKTTDSILPWNK